MTRVALARVITDLLQLDRQQLPIRSASAL